MLSWREKSFVRLSCRECKISDFRPWIWSLSEINIPEFLTLLINVWHLPLRQSLPYCLGWATQFILPAKSLNHTIPSPTFFSAINTLLRLISYTLSQKSNLSLHKSPSVYFQTFFFWQTKNLYQFKMKKKSLEKSLVHFLAVLMCQNKAMAMICLWQCKFIKVTLWLCAWWKHCNTVHDASYTSNCQDCQGQRTQWKLLKTLQYMQHMNYQVKYYSLMQASMKICNFHRQCELQIRHNQGKEQG